MLLLLLLLFCAQVVGEASVAMQAANIPHNVLIADCGSRVFIWPQAYAERQAKGLVPEHLLDCGVNPAVWEISGHMVLKRAQVGTGGGGETVLCAGLCAARHVAVLSGQYRLAW
jgi:hypothetical protein